MTEIIEGATLSQAKAVVHRLFKFRIRSEHEIRAKLKEKGFPHEIIEQAVAFFTKCEMLNDTIFAKAWIGSRLNKPMGLRRIKQELKEKGIADEIIASELTAAKSDYDESEAVKEVIKRRLRMYQGLDPIKKKRRLEGYLLRRGFSTETIYKILKRPGGP
jgi:regulatory protein